jgi:hypothetical protein
MRARRVNGLDGQWPVHEWIYLAGFGAAEDGETKRLVSGLRGLQSGGGKATRQKRECASVNSGPISMRPPGTELVSLTVQAASSLVSRVWPDA